METSGEKYSEDPPPIMDRSEPQIPDRIGFTRAQPGPRGTGSFSVASRNGASGPATSPSDTRLSGSEYMNPPPNSSIFSG